MLWIIPDLLINGIKGVITSDWAVYLSVEWLMREIR
jgi:hypothetical protein